MKRGHQWNPQSVLPRRICQFCWAVRDKACFLQGGRGSLFFPRAGMGSGGVGWGDHPCISGSFVNYDDEMRPVTSSFWMASLFFNLLSMLFCRCLHCLFRSGLKVDDLVAFHIVFSNHSHFHLFSLIIRNPFLVKNGFCGKTTIFPTLV